jgi:enamine deaminase RidA (YjgF/YER057c/UK114 family)
MDKAVIYTSSVGKVIPDGWPRWSLGIRVANFLFASGTGGVARDVGHRSVASPRDQGRIAMERLLTLMEAGGAVADDLISVRVYLDDPRNAEPILAGVGDFLREHVPPGAYPAFSMVIANTSEPSVHAEIEAFAATSHQSIRCSRVAAPYPTLGSWADHADVVRVGNLWFVSALLPLDSDGQLVSADPARQAEQVLANLDYALAECGREISDLVRLTVWISSRDVLAAVEATVAARLGAAFSAGSGPAVTALVAPLAASGALVQLEAVAATGHRRVIDPGVGKRPGALPSVPGVAVTLSTESDSFVRRFTWPEPVRGEPRDAPLAGRELGEIVFLSAQTGEVSAGTDGVSVVSGSMGEQTRHALETMRRITEAAGGHFADIAQFDIYYADRADYGAYNAARIDFLERYNPDSAWFAGSGPRAVSTTPGALIEIESIAVIQRR